MMASTKRALTRFILGDKETAQELIKVILEVDATERACAEKGEPNSYFRFRDEFKEDRLFATKEDLKHFKGKMKTQLMVADYYYEIEQWAEAAKRYRQFDKDYGNDLDRVARNYVDMMLGLSAQSEDKMSEAVKYFEKVFQNGRNTPSWTRSAFILYTFFQNFRVTEDKALGILQEIFSVMGPSSNDGLYAYYFLGVHLYGSGKLAKSKLHFQKFLKKYGDTVYSRGAKQYLEKIEIRLQNGKGEQND